MGFVLVGQVREARILPPQDGKGQGIGIARVLDMGFDSTVTFPVEKLPKDGVWIQGEARVTPDVTPTGKPKVKVSISQWREIQRPQS